MFNLFISINAGFILAMDKYLCFYRIDFFCTGKLYGKQIKGI